MIEPAGIYLGAERPVAIRLKGGVLGLQRTWSKKRTAEPSTAIGRFTAGRNPRSLTAYFVHARVSVLPCFVFNPVGIFLSDQALAIFSGRGLACE